jgi:WhiB family redox-sensing transcriptional regulator
MSRAGAWRSNRVAAEAAFPDEIYGRVVGLFPCRLRPELYFSEDPGELETAKTLCGGCWARADCLAGALARAEPIGVWGGEIFERGRVIPRKRPRGRPRKERPSARIPDEAAG